MSQLVSGMEGPSQPDDGCHLDARSGADERAEDKELDIDDSVYCLSFTCMISEIRNEFKLQNFLQDYFFKSTMVFFIQMLIITLIFMAGIASEDDENSDGLSFVEPTVTQMTLRLLCCYLFHLGNYKDVSDSFKRLKFLRYYPRKFDGGFLNPAVVITMY